MSKIYRTVFNCPHCGIQLKFFIKPPYSYDKRTERFQCFNTNDKSEVIGCRMYFDIHQQVSVTATKTNEQLRLERNKKLNKGAEMSDRMGGA